MSHGNNECRKHDSCTLSDSSRFSSNVVRTRWDAIHIVLCSEDQNADWKWTASASVSSNQFFSHFFNFRILLIYSFVIPPRYLCLPYSDSGEIMGAYGRLPPAPVLLCHVSCHEEGRMSTARPSAGSATGVTTDSPSTSVELRTFPERYFDLFPSNSQQALRWWTPLGDFSPPQKLTDQLRPQLSNPVGRSTRTGRISSVL